MAPSFDLHEDGPPLRKKAKTVDSEPNIECRVCFSPIDDASYVTPCRTCRKPICFECIKGQWLAALSDHERMPVRCCGRVVYHDVAKNILPPAELAIYKLRFDESSTPNPFYCPLPTCSTFIPPRLLKPVRGKITCDICATISCVRCKQPASEDHRCPNTNEKATILKSFNYKLCPKCGTGIMRMFGCAHVRCQCGAHWCWDCQRPINACYKKPCSAARDDGQDSEPDDVDSDSDVDEAPSVIDSTTAGAGSVDELSAATVTQPVSLIDAPNSSSNRDSEAATVVIEIVANAPTTSNTGESAKQEDPAVAHRNLDDPDDPDHDWEAEDFDFGDEPEDAGWDTWGCMHRFKDFTADDVPDQWLVALDKAKATAVECMGCFKTVSIEPMKPLGPKTYEECTAKEQERIEDAGKDAGETEAKEARKQKRRTQKNGAFECRGCGVIHCFGCRRMAVRQVSSYRKGGAVV